MPCWSDCYWEFRKLTFSSLSCSLALLVRHYLENICDVLPSVASSWYFWSWVNYTQIPNTHLSLLIQFKIHPSWLNPVPRVTAEARDRPRRQIHLWESQKMHFSYNIQCRSCHSELSLTLVRKTVSGFQHKYKLKVKGAERAVVRENSIATSKAAVTLV